MMKSINKLVAKMGQMEAKFSKLGVSAKADPRVPKPPGLGGQPPVAQPGSQREANPASPMEVEVKEAEEGEEKLDA